MPLKQFYDVVIVGGAMMGSSSAYFLASNPDFDGSILMVERDTSFARSSTMLSAAGVRNQFSNAVNIRMSQFCTRFFREFPEDLARIGETWQSGFQEYGYAYLARDTGADVLRRNHEVQEREGAHVRLLDRDALKSRFPFYNVEDIELCAYGEKGEGWFDAFGLCQAFRRAARAKGVESIEGEVVSLDVEDERVTAVTLATGETVQAGHVVNACGRHAAGLARMAGVEVPIEPRKRSVFVFDCRESIGQPLPLTIDPTGVFCRSEGNRYVAGCPPVTDPCAEFNDFEVVYDEFEEIVWPTLAHRIPAFEAIKLVDAWAGHYEYNTLDQNSVIGPHTRIGNFYFIAGFSGHGVQHGPAAGRGLSELVTYGEFRTIDMSELGYSRIEQARPFVEQNVI